MEDNRLKINEEMHLEKEWFEQAHEQTLETLPEFIRHVMNDYIHDYGTVCHAVSACAIAAAWAANNEPEGGITGFQAGFVMWDFVKQWEYPNNKLGFRLVNYDKLLYPQYEDRFRFESITRKQFEKLQEMAKESLGDGDACDAVSNHWQSIVDGKVPFGLKIRED